MRVPILMPQLGESIAEATIKAINVQQGDSVTADQDIIEVETEKAVMEVTAPCEGCVVEISAKENISYPVGTVLGYLEITDEKAEQVVAAQPKPQEGSVSENEQPAQDNQPASTNSLEQPGNPVSHSENTEVTPTIPGLPVPAKAKGATYISPRLRARMQELGLNAADLAGIAGSGAAGRVTVEDFEAFMGALEEKKTTAASSMRIAVADSMRRSWTRPLATVGAPVSQNLDQHSMQCVLLRLLLQKIPLMPDNSSVTKSYTRKPLISALLLRSMMGCSFQSSGMWTKNLFMTSLSNMLALWKLLISGDSRRKPQLRPVLLQLPTSGVSVLFGPPQFLYRNKTLSLALAMAGKNHNGIMKAQHGFQLSKLK